VASLPRSTYYFEHNKVDKDIKNKDLCDKIKTIFNDNKSRYGVRRVWAELRNQDINVNHKKVQRLMNKLGLSVQKKRQKYHSYVGEVGSIADNLIKQNFAASAPNEKWTTDVSQFNCVLGKCYLSPILDMYCGDIVAWILSLSPNFEQTNKMLDEAFKKHHHLDGLIFHSDQGWQYQMRLYHKRLENAGIRQSMSRKGNCLDNCIMESFFGTLKNEMFYGHEKEFKTFEEFKKAISEYIDYYNNKRIKAKTKWMPPSKFRETYILNL